MAVLPEPAQPLGALDLAGREREDPGRVSVRVGKRHVAPGLVRPLLVGMGHELGHQVPEVHLAEDQDVIQALGPQRLHPAGRVVTGCAGCDEGRYDRTTMVRKRAAPFPFARRLLTRSSVRFADALNEPGGKQVRGSDTKSG